MNTANAFVGKSQKPTAEQVSAALGSSANLWQELLDWLANEHAAAVQEWKSSGAKNGWSLQAKLKKRTIVHLSPCTDCFRAAVILGDRAVKAARQAHLSKSLAKTIEDAPKYPEGTGVRLLVEKAGDLAAVRQLVAIKLAN